MAVDVTLMMASRGFTICGSGTVSTRTSCFPCQVSARIAHPSAVRHGGARCGGGDLAGLHELFEPTQFAPGLNARPPLEQLCRNAAHRSAGRIVGDHRLNFGAASAGRIAK